MKKSFVVLLLVASLLLVACGTAEIPVTEAPASSEATSSQSSAVVESSAVAEASSSEAPASSEASSSAEAAPADVVEVQVVLGDNWVQSSITTFKVGVPYRLVITNSGGRVHNFNIHPVAEKSDAGIQFALDNALLSVPDSQLRPGSQVVVDFTFTQAGNFEFSCLIPRHFKSGQYFEVTVEP